MRRRHFGVRRMMRRTGFRTLHRMHHRPIYRRRPIGYRRPGIGYGYGGGGFYGRRPIVYAGGAAGGVACVIVIIIILVVMFWPF